MHCERSVLSRLNKLQRIIALFLLFKEDFRMMQWSSGVKKIALYNNYQ